MENHFEDWTEEEAINFVMNQIANFKSVEEGKDMKLIKHLWMMDGTH